MKNCFKWSLLLLVSSALFAGCSVPVTKVDVQKKEAMSVLTNIFFDRGFDIKFADKDAGVMTTEFKKFASMGESPPFDYFMQIKSSVRTAGDRTRVKLSPIVKEQNRMNAAAYTERSLSYFTGKSEDLKFIDSMRENVGWRSLGQILFMNVVSDTAEAFSMSEEDVIQNVTKTPKNALTVD